MPPQAKQVTIKEILEDHLGDTYPRVLAQVVNDEGKESKLTIFKSKKGIVPQVYHSYMGFFKKPKEGYHIWSYNIAWELHSEPTPDEPTEDEPKDEVVFDDPETKKVLEEALAEPPDETPEPPPTPPEPETTTNIEPPQIITHPDVNLRLAVANIEARRENRLTRNIPLSEFLDNVKRIIEYVETGE